MHGRVLLIVGFSVFTICIAALFGRIFCITNKLALIGQLLKKEKAREMELLKSDMILNFLNGESINELIKYLRIVKREASQR